MNYTHNLSSCFCTTAASGYPTGSGSFLKAQLSGTFGVSSSDTSSSGTLHTTVTNCQPGVQLFNVVDISPVNRPASTYRVFINTNDVDEPPQVGDEFAAVGINGISYVYNISAVSIV